MLYYLFDYLNELNFPGAGMFQYISFRAGVAVILSLWLTTVVGKRLIKLLQKQQIGETIRDLGLEGQMSKKGTPTMGGLIIIAGILLPILLIGKLDNIYLILMIVTTVWLGTMGFIDDYIKVVKKNKDGLAGRFKIFGQVGLGIIIGVTMWQCDDIVVRKNIPVYDQTTNVVVSQQTLDVKATNTTVPFYKDNNFEYSDLFSFMGEKAETTGWIFFIILVIIVVTAVSNGANMTDGLDGLATGTSAIIGTTLGIIAYVSSHVEFASYLNLTYVPYSEELVVYIAAFVGALIGFLWFNSYPAQVFMGDTGSLSIGGIIAVFAILIHKELLLPILCGIFLVENVSVMIQVGYFKYSKKKYGEGRRIFLMAPLHHHYQKKDFPEPKIVTRFWIVGIILAVLTLIITLKVR
ncbi:MAG: phospho-N-acetylmuramoyl-pentapeptide-transferase [Bacteroidales bacterium]|jgi:phospho-N-acetylmuramoyl-pentapeptide-transferase|nr:phospho-N-acetylmuramoyl-pentapeptide-transferase [Bacteroidales bacterium]